MTEHHDSPTETERSLEQVRRRLTRVERDLQGVRAALVQQEQQTEVDGTPLMMDVAPSERAQVLNRAGIHPPTGAVSFETAPTDLQAGPILIDEPEAVGDPSSFNIDVLDRDDEIVVIADLPGFDEDEIDVRFTDDGLQIEAVLEEDDKERSGTYLVRERPQSWVRAVNLPDTIERQDSSVESVEFEHGRLTIILQQSKITDRRIEI